MKIIMNKFSLLPLLLRSYVRMLCCQLLFVSVFISSKTPSLHGDSAIFISGDAYLYADRQIDISVTPPADKKLTNSTRSKYHQTKILKSLSKTAHVVVWTLRKREQPKHFTAPVDTQQLSSTGNFTSQAVMGTPFLRKLLLPMMSLAFLQQQSMTQDKKKSLSSASYPFKVNRISIHQFSRPPPILIIE